VLIGPSAHEVDPETLGAHAHDHWHGRVASAKFSAHTHSHVHLNDVKADGELNSHTHTRVHERLPWEDRDLD
jgi:hypothetical protein